MTAFIQLSQIAVVILVLALIGQIFRLERYRNPLFLASSHDRMDSNFLTPSVNTQKSPKTRHAVIEFTNDHSRAEGLAKAQTFAGIQILDSKRKGLAIRDGRQGDHIKIAAAYLTGASRAITLHLGINGETAEDVAAFLITHNLGVTGSRVNVLIEGITSEEILLQGYRNGLEAAESWLTSKCVPDELSLYSVMCQHLFV